MPAVVAFGDEAVPVLLSALRTGVEPRSQRGHFLLSSLGAILGPRGGVKQLEEAIAEARTPEGKTNLRDALQAFRQFQVVRRWLPEGEKQTFEGNVAEALRAE